MNNRLWPFTPKSHLKSRVERRLEHPDSGTGLWLLNRSAEPNRTPLPPLLSTPAAETVVALLAGEILDSLTASRPQDGPFHTKRTLDCPKSHLDCKEIMLVCFARSECVAPCQSLINRPIVPVYVLNVPTERSIWSSRCCFLWTFFSPHLLISFWFDWRTHKCSKWQNRVKLYFCWCLRRKCRRSASGL